jgi:hypothetical protein
MWYEVKPNPHGEGVATPRVSNHEAGMAQWSAIAKARLRVAWLFEIENARSERRMGGAQRYPSRVSIRQGRAAAGGFAKAQPILRTGSTDSNAGRHCANV